MEQSRRWTEQQVIEAFAEAIAHFEGFYTQTRNNIPTVPQRLNNPGDLRSWKDENGRPFPVVNGFVQFPDIDRGWRALRAQCRINIIKRQLTVTEFFAGKRGVYWGYANKQDGNDPTAYANFVYNKLTKILGGDIRAILAPGGVEKPVLTLFKEVH